MGITDSHPEKWLPLGGHGARITEDYTTTSLHNGQIFRALYYNTIGSGSTMSLMFTTGSKENIHISRKIDSGDPGVASFYEDTSASAGTAVTALNAFRSSSNVSSVVLVSNPTITSLGNRIGVNVIGSVGFKEDIGEDFLSAEWIPKASTSYLIKFDSDSASCRTVLRVLWMED